MRYTFYVIFTVFICSCSVTQKISKEINEKSEQEHFFKGLVVYDPQLSKEVININGNKYFTPASNTKLFTFYTAYKTLKDSLLAFEYAKINDSIFIKGTADPTFLYGFDSRLVLDFLKKDTSNVFLIDNALDESAYGPGWSWDDFTYYYMPEKSTFPIYGNIVTVSNTESGVEMSPEFFKSHIVFEENRWRRAKDENKFFINKSTAFKGRQIPFITSAQLTADLLSEKIGKKVVFHKGNETLKFQKFYNTVSDSVYKEMLTVSDNFIAEQLMLQVSYKTDSVFSVKKAIDYSLENLLVGIPQKPRWVDGSGLSRYNLFTPESYVYLLKKILNDIPQEKLFALLPAGGVSGTLKNHYKGQKPYVFAKSGTLSNNYNLSGYLITKKGKVLIFSYMNNHYKKPVNTVKKEINEVLSTLHANYN